DEHVAEPFDIHLAALAKPAQALFELRRTARIDATDVGRVGFLLDLRTAARTFGRRLDRFSAARAFLRDDFDDVWNHFAGALNNDGVAQVNIEPADLIDVVQRDVGDGDAGDEDGFELADRREIPALADLPIDVFEDRRLLLGFIFVGDDPARGFARGAQAVALPEIVNLHD